MAAKMITITATAPDGTEVSTNVSAKREVGAIRIMDTRAWGAEHLAKFGPWLVTVHKSLPNAITGPNQTPVWNGKVRHAIAIVDGRPVGPWLGCTK